MSLERVSPKTLLDRSTFTSMQKSAGKWIISQQGEYCGSIRRLKMGWKLDPYPTGSPGGRQKEACELAASLLDKAGEK
jgi:hypothetical protein